MHTGAMGNTRIFTQEYEHSLLPHSLHANLLTKAQANLGNNASIIRQYRRKQTPIDRPIPAEHLFDHLSGRQPVQVAGVQGSIPLRPRTDSTVRFADQVIQTSRKSEVDRAPTIRRTPSPPHGPTSLSPIDSFSKNSESFSFVHESPAEPQSNTILERPSFVATTSNLTHMSSASNASLDQWLRSSPTDKTFTSADLIKGPPSMSYQPIITAENDSRRLMIDLNAEEGATQTADMFIHLHRNTNSAPRRVNATMYLDQRNLTEEERFHMDYGDAPLPGVVNTTAADNEPETSNMKKNGPKKADALINEANLHEALPSEGELLHLLQTPVNPTHHYDSFDQNNGGV